MPHITVNALLRKEWALLDGTFRTQLDFRYTGRDFAALSHAPDTSLPGNGVLNARVSYAKGDHWETSSRVTNIANRAVEVYAFDTAAFYGSTTQSYAPPLWITLEARYHW